MIDDMPFWENTPSHDDEAWWIKSLADRQRGKWPPVPNPWTPGFNRRIHRGTAEVFGKLAVLQQRYRGAIEREEIQKIGRHAMLLLIPMFAAGHNRLCQFSGKPCAKLKDGTDPRGLPIVRCQLRRGRFLLAWQIIMQNALKEGPAGHSGYSWPIISVRERTKKNEIWPSERGQHAKVERERKQFVIGMAVLREYRENAGVGNSIDAAFAAVAAKGKIDGVKTGGDQNVRLRYRNFRKLCFIRGYADERAFSAQYNCEPWPIDQLWLADFPQNAEG